MDQSPEFKGSSSDRIYHWSEFEVMLGEERDRSFISDQERLARPKPLILLLMQPVNPTIDRQSLNRIGQVLLKPPRPGHVIIGETGINQFGAILPYDLRLPLLWTKRIIETSPEAVGIGLASLLHRRNKQTESANELFKAAIEALVTALEKAQKEGKSEVVALLREGQQFSMHMQRHLPREVQRSITLIHK